LEASGVQAAARNARIDVESVYHDVVNIGPSAVPCIATKERTSVVSGWGNVSEEFKPVVSRADSHLIVFRSMRNEEGINGNHYYLIDDDGELKHLHSTDAGGDFKAALKAK
jgi:hypothetical protein